MQIIQYLYTSIDQIPDHLKEYWNSFIQNDKDILIDFDDDIKNIHIITLKYQNIILYDFLIPGLLNGAIFIKDNLKSIYIHDNFGDLIILNFNIIYLLYIMI